MSKEALEKRITELNKALEQIQANGNATLGAIAECKYWLEQLEKEVNIEEIGDSWKRSTN